MVLVCGVDEAGRGPVIGPLVIAGVLIEEKNISELDSMGVKDSKLLSPKKRNLLFAEIKKVVKKYEVIIVQPKEIDEALESANLNLNWLEAIKTAQIINALKPDKAILDCPSNNIQAYVEYLRVFLKDKKVKIVAEHKADMRYKIVGASSILAKVTRDKEIEKIQKKFKEPMGSGYPSDPSTQKFLKKNWNKYPKIFRKSWSSWQKLAKAEKQKSLKNYSQKV